MSRLINRFLTGLMVTSLLLGSYGCSSYEPPDELVAAVQDGDDEQVAALLAQGSSPNQVDGPSDTPVLCFAAEAGSIEVVKLLVDGGADVNKGDKYGMTALHFAAANESPELITFLISKGADPQAKNNLGKTPADLATEMEAMEIVSLLKSKGG